MEEITLPGSFGYASYTNILYTINLSRQGKELDPAPILDLLLLISYALGLALTALVFTCRPYTQTFCSDLLLPTTWLAS